MGAKRLFRWIRKLICLFQLFYSSTIATKLTQEIAVTKMHVLPLFPQKGNVKVLLQSLPKSSFSVGRQALQTVDDALSSLQWTTVFLGLVLKIFVKFYFT